MAEFGQFLINNMRSSLEPEDLRILNRNSTCGYRLSNKSDNFCSPIKEEDNDLDNNNNNNINSSNNQIDDKSNVKNHDIKQKVVQEDDKTTAAQIPLAKFLMMKRLETTSESEIMNAYKMQMKIGNLNNKLDEQNREKNDVEPPSQASSSNFGVRSIKWGSYMESWKHLAEKYNSSRSNKQATASRLLDVEQIQKMQSELEQINCCSEAVSSRPEQRLVAKALNCKINVKNSVYKCKKYKNTKSTTESTDEISSNSQKVTNNPIYVPDSKLRSDILGKIVSMSNQEEATTITMKKSQHDMMSSLKPTIKFEINQLLMENNRHVIEDNTRSKKDYYNEKTLTQLQLQQQQIQDNEPNNNNNKVASNSNNIFIINNNIEEEANTTTTVMRGEDLAASSAKPSSDRLLLISSSTTTTTTRHRQSSTRTTTTTSKRGTTKKKKKSKKSKSKGKKSLTKKKNKHTTTIRTTTTKYKTVWSIANAALNNTTKRKRKKKQRPALEEASTAIAATLTPKSMKKIQHLQQLASQHAAAQAAAAAAKNPAMSIYRGKVGMKPTRVTTATPSDAPVASSSSSASRQQQQHPNSESRSQSTMLDKCKAKNKEKMMLSWDKIMKKAVKDPDGLRQMLKVKTENERLVVDKHEKKADITMKTSKTPTNTSKKDKQQQNSSKNNMSRFFGIKKKLHRGGTKSRKWLKKTANKIDENNEQADEKRTNEQLAQTGLTNTNNNGGELVRSLFSYLNNYSEDGSTIRKINNPKAAKSNPIGPPQQQRATRGPFMPLFNRRLINVAGLGVKSSDLRLIESSLTFKTTSNYRVNSSNPTTASNGRCNLAPAGGSGAGGSSGVTKSTTTAEAGQPTTYALLSTTNSTTESSESNEMHTAEEKIQLTRKNHHKIVAKQKVDAVKQFPYYYFKCCMERNSESTIGSRSRQIDADYINEHNRTSDDQEDEEDAAAQHNEDDDDDDDEEDDNETMIQYKGLLNEPPPMNQINHQPQAAKTNAFNTMNYVDLEKLIKSLGNDDKKIEMLKKKLSVYIRSKQRQMNLSFEQSSTMADATETVGNSHQNHQNAAPPQTIPPPPPHPPPLQPQPLPEKRLFNVDLLHETTRNLLGEKDEYFTDLDKNSPSSSSTSPSSSSSSVMAAVAAAEAEAAEATTTIVSKDISTALQTSECETIYDNKENGAAAATSQLNGEMTEPVESISRQKEKEQPVTNTEEIDFDHLYNNGTHFDRRMLKLIEDKLQATRSATSFKTRNVTHSEAAKNRDRDHEPNIEMFYFTSDSPTRRTLMMNKTEAVEKQQQQICNEQQRKPSLKESSQNEGFYFQKVIGHQETVMNNSNISNNEQRLIHEYKHQNMFKTLTSKSSLVDESVRHHVEPKSIVNNNSCSGSRRNKARLDKLISDLTNNATYGMPGAVVDRMPPTNDRLRSSSSSASAASSSNKRQSEVRSRSNRHLFEEVSIVTAAGAAVESRTSSISSASISMFQQQQQQQQPHIYYNQPQRLGTNSAQMMVLRHRSFAPDPTTVMNSRTPNRSASNIGRNANTTANTSVSTMTTTNMLNNNMQQYQQSRDSNFFMMAQRPAEAVPPPIYGQQFNFRIRTRYPAANDSAKPRIIY